MLCHLVTSMESCIDHGASAGIKKIKNRGWRFGPFGCLMSLDKNIFWLIKWRLFSWSDTILGHGEALVFYRIFSFTFINFFKILNFGLISFENSTENRFQSVSVTIKITDNREYRPIFKTLHWRGGRRHTGQVGTRQDHEYQATSAGKLDVSCEKSRKRYVYIDLSSRSNLSHVLLQIGPSIN